MYRSGVKAQGPVGGVRELSLRPAACGSGGLWGAGDSGLRGASSGVIVSTGPPSQLGTSRAPAGTRLQAPGRPMLGWMTHRFLGIPGLRKCSRRHGALPLAGQALTGCWRVEKNALGPHLQAS